MNKTAYTVWFQSELSSEKLEEAIVLYRKKLEDEGKTVDLLDVKELAAKMYKRGISQLGFALGLSATMLNQNGISLIFYGSRSGSDSIEWSSLRPEKIMDFKLEESESSDSGFSFVPVVKTAEDSAEGIDAIEEQDRKLLEYMKKLDD